MGRHHVLVSFILIFFLLAPCVPAFSSGSVPELNGRAGILIDYRNGQVLFEEKSDLSLYPASTTKILTGILMIEEAEMDSVVEVSRDAANSGGTLLGLQEDEKIKMEDLLYAVLLNSANDASAAAAEYIAGSVQEFSRMMNKKARELGAVNSNFVNPHGMPDPKHRSTARDLAVISRYAMQNEQFRDIVSTQRREIERGVPEEKEPQKWVNNHNKLIFNYEGATGIKTGYTIASGHCIVASAKKGSRELIAVVLGCSSQQEMYYDAAALLDYGFNHYETRLLVKENQVMGQVPVPGCSEEIDVKTENRVIYNFPVDSDKKVIYKIKARKGLEVPVEKGEKVAYLIIEHEGQELGKVPLYAAGDASREITARPWFLLVIFVFLLGGGTFGLKVWNHRRRKKFRR